MSEELTALQGSGVKLVGSRAPVGSARRPATLDERRVCSVPGCPTILSRYNLATRCRLHSPARFVRVRGVPNTAD